MAKIYSLAQKIRNEDNLFFSFETKDKLNLVGQKLENQLVVAQEYLRLGQFQQGEPIIKELLTNGFEFHATIILAQKEQKMLNDPFLVDTIFGKTKFFVTEYKK